LFTLYKKDYIIKSKRLKRGKNVSLLRHDMRHFLNNIAAFIENNENDKALAHKRYARCNRKRAWAWYKKHQTDC